MLTGEAFLFLSFQESQRRITNNVIIRAVVSHCDNCGRLPAAVPVGTVTYNRTPYTQRLPLTRELSGDDNACLPTSLSLLLLLLPQHYRTDR